jgi:hypothetical protein
MVSLADGRALGVGVMELESAPSSLAAFLYDPASNAGTDVGTPAAPSGVAEEKLQAEALRLSNEYQRLIAAAPWLRDSATSRSQCSRPAPSLFGV